MAREELEALPKPEMVNRILELRLRQEAAEYAGVCLRSAAAVFFAGLIITIPFRYRAILLVISYPPIYRDYTDVLFFASDFFLLATLAIWATSLLLHRRITTFGPAFLTIPIFLLPAIGLLSTLSSVAASISLYNTVRLILLVGLYLYVLNEVRSIETLVIPVGIQVFVQSMVAIGQILRQSSIGLQLLGELKLDPQVSGISILVSGGERILRAYGLSDHPNILGGSLALGLIFLLVAYPSVDQRWRLIYTSTFALGNLALFLTFSRSAWVAFLLGSLMVVILQLKYHFRQSSADQLTLILATAVLLLPFLWYYAPLAGVRLNYRGSFDQVPQEQQALGERTLLIRSANQVFLQRPLTGAGLAAFPVALMQAQPQFPVDYQPAHFVLLEVAAETGIFGGLVYFILMVAPWIALFVNRRKITFSVQLIGVSALLLAITVIGFFDYYTWLLAPGRLWQYLIWGLFGAVYLTSTGRAEA